MHSPYSFYVQLDDEMGEACRTKQPRAPDPLEICSDQFFSKCLNEIGDGELTTSSGSEYYFRWK